MFHWLNSKKARKMLAGAVVSTISALALLSGNASAEQAKAKEYRELISSGRFYIEYGMVQNMTGDKIAEKFEKARHDMGMMAFAVDGTRWESYTKGIRSGDSMAMQKSIQTKSPVFKDWNKYRGSNGKWRPDTIYEEGKYYQFFGKNDALLTKKEDINTRPIAVQRAPLPRFLLALAPDQAKIIEPTVVDARGGVVPTYVSECVESGTETFNNQTMNFDKYKVSEASANGSNSETYYTTYTLYYDDSGNLRFVKQKYNVPKEIEEMNREAHEQAEARMEARMAAIEAVQKKRGLPVLHYEGDPYYEVEKFTGNIPADAFSFPLGCKVYEIDTGSLDELVGGDPVLVEQH